MRLLLVNQQGACLLIFRKQGPTQARVAILLLLVNT